jgi:hypothetical protein
MSMKMRRMITVGRELLGFSEASLDENGGSWRNRFISDDRVHECYRLVATITAPNPCDAKGSRPRHRAALASYYSYSTFERRCARNAVPSAS